jgi:basic membrane protein A
MKRVDNAVYSAIKAFADGSFEGGHYLGTAKNGGIGYAPFHDAESKVSKSVKSKLDQIMKKLADGSLETGVKL